MISTLLRRRAALIMLAGLLAGCQTAKTPAPVLSSDGRSIRNNCYSLLHQLLSEQKDVSKLRFIKHENPDIKLLVNRIAATCRAGAKELEGMAKADPEVVLVDTWLPAGEVKTRDAISKTKEKDLLHTKGQEFELTLLLTQTEALSYGWHLALVTAEYEPQMNRAQRLRSLGKDMEDLYRETVSLMHSKEAPPVKR